MSISNPFSSNFGWKVDPDGRQNRCNGPCLTRIMTDEERIKYGIAVREDDVVMLKMTKKEVLEMHAAGKTLDEIVDYFTQGNTKDRSTYSAKATLFLHGPKEKEKKITKDKAEKCTCELPVTLKTRLVEDTENLLRFELGDDALTITSGNDAPVWISWDKLDIFIGNLQKLKQLHEAV
jgi:hypothetical protein